jgi:hypothetical protein
MKRCYRIFESFTFLLMLSLGCSNSRSLPSGNADVSLLTGEWVVAAQTVSPLTITPTLDLGGPQVFCRSSCTIENSHPKEN